MHVADGHLKFYAGASERKQYYKLISGIISAKRDLVHTLYTARAIEMLWLI